MVRVQWGCRTLWYAVWAVDELAIRRPGACRVAGWRSMRCRERLAGRHGSFDVFPMVLRAPRTGAGRA